LNCIFVGVEKKEEKSSGSSSGGDPPGEEWILIGYATGSDIFTHGLLFYAPELGGGEFKFGWQMRVPPIEIDEPTYDVTLCVDLVVYRDNDESGNLTVDEDGHLVNDEVIWHPSTMETTDYGTGIGIGGAGPTIRNISDWTNVRWFMAGFALWKVREPEEPWWKELGVWGGLIVGLAGIGVAVVCVTTAMVGCTAIGIALGVIGVGFSLVDLFDWGTKFAEYKYGQLALCMDGPLGTETSVSSSWLYGPHEGNDTGDDDIDAGNHYEVGQYILHTTVQRFNKISLKFYTPQHGSVTLYPAVSGLKHSVTYITIEREYHQVTFEAEMDLYYMRDPENGWLQYVGHTPDGIPVLEFDLIVPVDYEIYDLNGNEEGFGWPSGDPDDQPFKAEWKVFGVVSQATGEDHSQEQTVHINWSPTGFLFPMRDWIIQILESRPYYFIDLSSFDIVILRGNQPALREEMVNCSLSNLNISAMQINPYDWVMEDSPIGALIDPDGYVHREITSMALPTVTKRISVPDPNHTIVYAPGLHDFVLHIEQGPISPLAGVLSLPLNLTGFPSSITLDIIGLDDPLKIMAPFDTSGEINAIYLEHPDKASVIIPKLENASLRIPGSKRATEITLGSDISQAVLSGTIISLLDPKTTTIIRMPNVLGPVTISLLESTGTPVRTGAAPTGIPYTLSMFIDVQLQTTNVKVFGSGGNYGTLAQMTETSAPTITPQNPFTAQDVSSGSMKSISISHTSYVDVIAKIDLTNFSGNDDDVVFYTPSAISSRDDLPFAGWITCPYERVELVQISVAGSSEIYETLPHGLVLGEFPMPAVSPGQYDVTMQYSGYDLTFCTSDDKSSSTKVTVTSDPTISNVRTEPESPTSADPVTVYADVEDNNGILTGGVKLFWKRSTELIWNLTTMSQGTGKTYSAVIPKQPAGTIQFYVQASDTLANIATSPPDAPTVSYTIDTDPPKACMWACRGTHATACIIDNIGVEMAILYWKTDTETTWHLIAMTPAPKHSWCTENCTWCTEDLYTSREAIPDLPPENVTYHLKVSDPSNNTGEIILHTHKLGDINADGKVNVKDIFAIAKAFGSEYLHPGYYPNLDINRDGKINVKDIFAAAKNFGYEE